MSDVYARNHRFSARHDLLRLLDQASVRPRRVLDIGCGSGLVGEALLHRGAREVWGIEKDPERASIAQRRLSRVICSDWPATPLGQQTFDLIIFADSLEHMTDPWHALSASREVLSENGFVLISLPNVSHCSVALPLLFGRWAYGDSGLLDRTHLRFFTPSSARLLLDESGLEVRLWKNTGPFVWPQSPTVMRLLGPRPLHLLVYEFLLLASARRA